MKILVSSCLLGENCKYNGRNNYRSKVKALKSEHELVPVCPECLGGYPAPRTLAEIVDGVVFDRDGNNVDKGYREGAEKACQFAIDQQVDYAILQSRSPSCGVNQVYDGSFTGKLVNKPGVFAHALMDKGIKVVDVEDL